MADDRVFERAVHGVEDTGYHASKGYRVAGADADPSLVEEVTRRFGPAIRDGRL
jgi:hypothetical protein